MGEMTPYTVGRLDSATWDAFAELVERNNGGRLAKSELSVG
jgi:hypothetical protein